MPERRKRDLEWAETMIQRWQPDTCTKCGRVGTRQFLLGPGGKPHCANLDACAKRIRAALAAHEGRKE